MNDVGKQTSLNVLEKRVVAIGFWLSGIVVAVVAVSYILYSPFPYRFLVWLIGVAFAAVALLSFEWPRGYGQTLGEAPKGKLRTFLLVAMPLAFIVDSQLCGLGFRACTVLCNVISFTLIVLAIIIAISIAKGKSVGPLLIIMVIVSLIPHCVCMAPINTIWHSIFGGYAPTCQVMPLVVVLFAISSLRGVRPRLSAALAVLVLIVILFIAVANPLIGFPWQGCVR